MTALGDFPLANQARAVSMLVSNAAAQLVRFAAAPTDPGQLRTTRKACELARDTLNGFLARLPGRAVRGAL